MTYDPNYQWQQPQSAPPGYPISGPPGFPPVAPQPPKRSYLGLIIALIVAIVVVGCGGTVAVLAIVGSKPSPKPTSISPPTQVPTGDGTGAVDSGTTGTNSGPVAFGADHSVQWNDKLTASVVTVKRFTPSSTAAGTHPGQAGIKVTVKITNNSDKQFDLTLADVKVKSGPDGTQADTIFDSDNNLGMGFEGSIAPGHSATADYGFSVPPGDLSKVDVEVSPGFDYDPGIFEGSVS